jgi:hypothetical protein
MKYLKVIVHVSTAYIHSYRTDINEIIYPMNEDPNLLLQSLDYLNDKIFENLSKKILKNYPNTYTYTKSLAEYLILQQGHNLPIGKLIFKNYYSIYYFSNYSTINHWCCMERTNSSKYKIIIHLLLFFLFCVIRDGLMVMLELQVSLLRLILFFFIDFLLFVKLICLLNRLENVY